ncbi:MAG: thioredoxin [Coprobacillus sp.]
MKKILVFVLSIFILVGCTSTKTKKVEINGIQEINYQELTKSLNSDVKFVLYIGRPDCGDCQVFYPVLEKYIQDHEGTGIYYLNIKNFRDKAKAENASQEEKDFYDNLYEELHFDWTPTIHVISNGKFIKTYQYLDEDYIKIKDREEQLKKKQQFLDEFEKFMDEYLKEEA